MNHFDGKKFFNPGARRRETLWDILRLILAMVRAPKWKSSPRGAVPALASAVGAGEAVVTFVSHATLLVQTQSLNFLTDPVWSKRASPFSFIGPKRFREPGVSLEQLPRIDVVLISHNHYDHMDVETIKKLKTKFDPLFLVAKGDERHMRRFGVENVRELDWWETIEVENGTRVTYTPAQHFSSRTPFDRDRSLWGGFMIGVGGDRIYFAGDTGYSSHFSAIRERLGAPDLAFLPIGAYEPYWFMGPVHMNPYDSVRAHLDLQSRKSIAMHFGTFRLTTEPIDEPERELKRALAEKGLTEKDFATPIEGQTFVIRFSDSK